MSNNLLKLLPFYNATNLELLSCFQRRNVKKLLDTHNLGNILDKYLAQEIQSSINCNYYHENKLCQIIQKCPPKLSLLHHNIRSFPKHRFELELMQECIGKQFDVIGLTEIGANNIESSAAFFKDYDLFYDPARTKCGGAALLIQNNTDIISERDDLKLPNTHNDDPNYLVESKWVEVRVKGLKRNVVIGCIYRHPKGKIDLFTNQLDKACVSIMQEDKICITCGDLNINALAQNHDQTAAFLNTMLSVNMIPHITLPTRITYETATLIDHIFVSYNKYVCNEDIISGNIINDISDHLPNFLLIGEGENEKHGRSWTRIQSEKNIDHFKTYLQSIDWSILDHNDCNKALGDFLEILNKGYENCFPLTLISRKRSKDKKWVTTGIKNSSNTKHRLYRLSLAKPTDAKITRYKQYRNALTSVCQKAETEYYQNLLDDKKASVKKLWDIFGSVVNPGRRRNKKNLIDKLIIDDKVISERNEIANCFNNYFVNVGVDLAKKIKSSASFDKYMRNKLDNSMFLRSVTRDELEKEIAKLDTKKSSGPMSISNKLIKECSTHLLTPLLSIINTSFRTGVFPEDMKLAKVIPLFKKENKHLVGNYRPISLLNVFSKITEKLMYRRLYSFLSRFNVLYQWQFGFRAKHSTVQALIDILERIHDSMDSGNYVLGLYIDLRKAFDTVNHSILLQKLEHYGVRGIVNKWFTSYLKGRKQYVEVNGVNSKQEKVTLGVPQGSVLGPLLFLIYVNDIANAVTNPNAKIMLFADDTNVFIENKNANTLLVETEGIMTELADWFSENMLSLSIEKTQYSIFHHRNKRLPENCDSVTFGTHPINRVDEAKYLGVILDDKLNWDAQTKAIIKCLVKYASSFKIIKRFLPARCKQQLFYGYVYSKIQYAIEVYGHASKRNIKSIQTMQNRILKILFCKDWFTPTPDLHKELELLTVEDVFHLQVCQFVKQQKLGLLPNLFDDYFQENADVHDHYTRNSTSIHLIRKRTKAGQKTIKYQGVKLFNALPDEILVANGIKSFRSKVKKHFISRY